MDHSMMTNLLSARFKSMVNYNESLQSLRLARQAGDEDDVRIAQASHRTASITALEFASKSDVDAIDNHEYVGV